MTLIWPILEKYRISEILMIVPISEYWKSELNNFKNYYMYFLVSLKASVAKKWLLVIVKKDATDWVITQNDQ